MAPNLPENAVKVPAIEYEIVKSDFTGANAQKIATICVEIFAKNRSQKSFAEIVDEIVQTTKFLPPYCNVDGSMICVLRPFNFVHCCNDIVGTLMMIQIPSDSKSNSKSKSKSNSIPNVRIVLYKSTNNEYIQQNPTKKQVSQLAKIHSNDIEKFRFSLRQKFGGRWTVIGAPINNQWAFAFDSPKNWMKYEIKLGNYKTVTAMQCARTELIIMVQNQLPINREKIPEIAKEIYEKFNYKTENFNKIANGVLDQISTMEPYVGSKNPIRCMIYKGSKSIYDRVDTLLWLEFGDFHFGLYQDRFPQPLDPYDPKETQDFLQTLAEKYRQGMTVIDTFATPLQKKFNEFYWDALVVKEDFDSFAIATRPSNLPMIKARGPKGEPIFAWALSKE